MDRTQKIGYQTHPQNKIEEILDSIRAELKEMPTLAMMVMCVVKAIRPLAAALIAEETQRRADLPEHWPRCPHCGQRLCSKGFKPREIRTLVGLVKWRRRVGRCPNRCKDAQVAPLDKRLDIRSQQKTSDEIKKLACLLVIYVPFDSARILLQHFDKLSAPQLTGIEVSTDSMWAWAQEAGQRIIRQIEVERQAMAAGKLPEVEFLAEHLQQSPLAIGADGVMVPVRPEKGTPAGKTIWREIKVGIMTRLTARINRKGESVPQLEQRRVVAVMGSVDEFMPILQLEANKQNISQATRVVWLCDGGKGFWRIFESWLQGMSSMVRRHAPQTQAW